MRRAGPRKIAIIAIAAALAVALAYGDNSSNDAADGFNLLPNYVPDSIADFVELVLPELRRRGLFRHEYEGQTLRENLGLPSVRQGWLRLRGDRGGHA